MAPTESKSGEAVIDDKSSLSPPMAPIPSRSRKRSMEVAFAADESNTTQESNKDAEESKPSTKETPKRRSSRVVTPSQLRHAAGLSGEVIGSDQSLRRAIFSSPVSVAPTTRKVEETAEDPHVKRKLIFGKCVVETHCPKNVHDVYKIVSKLTGSVGGNGSFGAIYGELTMGSMQKMVNLMKKHTALDSTSRYIDVGSGLGKPNLHVCQDPGVEFSYGIEMEMSRWMLGMANLQAVVKAASVQQTSGGFFSEHKQIGYNCYFEHGNIMDAVSFDPFTHVYMFSIGFPSTLWLHLADMFNRSSSSFLICYHSPSAIISKYGFNVELLVQAPTSMHGSKERHMGYIYERIQKKRSRENHCDPLFKDAWATVQNGLEMLDHHIESRMQETSHERRMTRSRGVTHTAISRIEVEEAKKKEEEAKKKEERAKKEEPAKKAKTTKKKPDTANGRRMTPSRSVKHTAVSEEKKEVKKAETTKKHSAISKIEVEAVKKEDEAKKAKTTTTKPDTSNGGRMTRSRSVKHAAVSKEKN